MYCYILRGHPRGMVFQGFLDTIIRMSVFLYNRPPTREEALLSTSGTKGKRSTSKSDEFDSVDFQVGLLRKELPISLRLHLFLKETGLVNRARSIRKTVGGRNHSAFARMEDIQSSVTWKHGILQPPTQTNSKRQKSLFFPISVMPRIWQHWEAFQT